MESYLKYKKKFKDISALAFSYGIKSISHKLRSKDLKEVLSDPRNAQIFKHSCHEGFEKAQKNIINELIYYQTQKKLIQSKLKKTRIKHGDITSHIEKLKIIKRRISNYRHIADSIAWQLLQGEIHAAKRFFIGEKGNKNLLDSNIEHCIEVADKINSDRNKFALISDLTNYIQIGDLIVREDDKIGIIELKEGKVNQQIESFINAFEPNNPFPKTEDFFEKFDSKTIKQIERVLNQKERMINLVDVLKNDQGKDSITGKPIIIHTPSHKQKSYNTSLTNLEKQLKLKNWHYELVENCLHIGAYKDDAEYLSNFVIEEILKLETQNYLIIDWSSITNNLSQPIFSKPLSPDFITNILLGELKVIIGINFDKMIELYNIIGIDTRFLSKKETAEILKQHGKGSIFTINNRGIICTSKNGVKIPLGEGLITRILYDNILPSSIGLSLVDIT